MTTFCPTDLQHLINCTKQNVGQIGLDTLIGKYLYDYAQNPLLYNYLEIGTWNGLGSTRCIIDGLLSRNNTNYKFYSLECNPDKVKLAQEYYKNIENVYILNEVLLNNMPSDIEEIFPELKINEKYKFWNKVDFDNMKDKLLFFNRTDLPEIFDIILLDGGEFTTYYEYQIIKNRCRILILDDTNVNKCAKIVQDIKSHPEKWSIVSESNERNGTLIVSNKQLCI
jgi:hypothetical protein